MNNFAVHPSVNGMIGRNWGNAFPISTPEAIGGAPGAEGLMASIAVSRGGAEINGRLSAGLIGMIVVGLGAFYIATRGIQF